MAKIQAIYRYPIKGLSPEALKRATLSPGLTIPGDRLYAIENGPSGFDPAAPGYLAKTHFLMLMRNERLAALRTMFDPASHVLTILHAGQGISADLRTASGREAIESFFARYCADELRGAPKVLYAEGHSFSDVARKVVSIINLNSVAAIEDMVDAPVHPLRFRANLYVEGWPAWSELDLVGRELAIAPPAVAAAPEGSGPSKGSPAVRLKIVKRIVRCAATNVDPNTGLRDLEIPQALMRHLDHMDCGIYAEVVEGGEIEQAGRIEIVPQ